MEYMHMFLLESLVCIVSLFNYVPKKNFLKKIGYYGAMLVEERVCVSLVTEEVSWEAFVTGSWLSVSEHICTHSLTHTK